MDTRVKDGPPSRLVLLPRIPRSAAPKTAPAATVSSFSSALRAEVALVRGLDGWAPGGGR